MAVDGDVVKLLAWPYGRVAMPIAVIVRRQDHLAR